ncbi:MAG: hypothetical protein ACRDMY_03910 [Gaiellaceae bacterium]
MPLPSPDRHNLPTEAAIAVPVPPDGLTLYRLLDASEPRQKDFEPTYTRPQAQIRAIPELFRASVSCWLQPEQALTALRRPRVWSAQLELRQDPLTRVALTELDPHGESRPGHVDVWAYPRELLASVIDVVLIER